MCKVIWHIISGPENDCFPSRPILGWKLAYKVPGYYPLIHSLRQNWKIWALPEPEAS